MQTIPKEMESSRVRLIKKLVEKVYLLCTSLGPRLKRMQQNAAQITFFDFATTCHILGWI